jgi:RHS repeat-associated protein
LPYGEEITAVPTANDRTKFATYFRDDQGYDYADQRYYSQGSGRFLTPDPYMASGGAGNPGSWNRYAYVVGDPVNLRDPRGLYYEGPGDASGGGGGDGGGGSGNDRSPTYEEVGIGTEGGGVEDSIGTQGSGRGFISVRNPSKTGPNQDRIRTVATWIRNNIDPDCERWLTGVKDVIPALFGDDDQTTLIGHGEFVGRPHTGAFTGNNPKQTNVPEGFAITINDSGAFFRSSYQQGGVVYTLRASGHLGGTGQAQTSILLHEFAHLLKASGFKPDFEDSAAQASNERELWRNCEKTIKSARGF